MNSILDAALGVAIVFAAFALVVSGINEVIASRLNLRGKQLFDALNKLMGNKAVELLNDPMLAPLNRLKPDQDEAGVPVTTVAPKTDANGKVDAAATKKAVRKQVGAYLPSWLFASALLTSEVRNHLAALSAELPLPKLASAEGDEQAKVNEAAATTQTVEQAAADETAATTQMDQQAPPDDATSTSQQAASDALAGEIGGPLADILQRLWADASGDFTKLEASLANWFDGYMDRVSGWYQRHIRVIMLAIALVVAVIGNVDAVSLTRQVISDAPLRAVLSQDASTIKACPAGSSSLECAQQDLKSIPGAQLGLFWSSSCPKVQTVVQSGRTQTTVVTTNGVAGAAVTKQQTGPAKVTQTCLDNGWWAQHGFDSAIDGFLRVLGLLIGAFAISLGAPFWFDLIGRGVSLKGSGPAPAPASTSSS